MFFFNASFYLVDLYVTKLLKVFYTCVMFNDDLSVYSKLYFQAFTFTSFIILNIKL